MKYIRIGTVSILLLTTISCNQNGIRMPGQSNEAAAPQVPVNEHETENTVTATPPNDGNNVPSSSEANPSHEPPPPPPAPPPPAPPPAPKCVAAPSGLVSWWRAEGNANDEMGLNHGALNNGAQIVPGKVGSAFSFDGIDDYVDVPNSESLALTQQVSMEAWIKPDPVPMGSNVFLFVKNTTPPPGGGPLEEAANTPYGVYLSSGDDRIRFRSLALLELVSTKSASSLSDGQFHHLAITFDGKTAKLYLDGALDSSKDSFGGAIAKTEGHFNIGNYAENRNTAAYKYPINSYKGLIDDLALYNRALTDAEVSAIYQGGSDGKCKK